MLRVTYHRIGTENVVKKVRLSAHTFQLGHMDKQQKTPIRIVFVSSKAIYLCAWPASPRPIISIQRTLYPPGQQYKSASFLMHFNYTTPFS
jgi:hypothetical protein